MSQKNIESHLVEKRVFKPSKDFSKKARIGSLAEYKTLWEESIKKPDKFWAREASELVWQQKWTKVLEWKEPFAKWFVGAKLNVSENCLDRHLGTPRQNKAAILWEGEPGENGRSPTSNSTAKCASSPTYSRRTTSKKASV